MSNATSTPDLLNQHLMPTRLTSRSQEMKHSLAYLLRIDSLKNIPRQGLWRLGFFKSEMGSRIYKFTTYIWPFWFSGLQNRTLKYQEVVTNHRAPSVAVNAVSDLPGFWGQEGKETEERSCLHLLRWMTKENCHQRVICLLPLAHSEQSWREDHDAKKTLHEGASGHMEPEWRKQYRKGLLTTWSQSEGSGTGWGIWSVPPAPHHDCVKDYRSNNTK